MYNKDQFIHDLAKHLTNALFIVDALQEQNESTLFSIKQELELLTSELENMSQVLKQGYN